MNALLALGYWLIRAALGSALLRIVLVAATLDQCAKTSQS